MIPILNAGYLFAFLECVISSFHLHIKKALDNNSLIRILLMDKLVLFRTVRFFEKLRNEIKT
jgi:hypothetical protein